MMMSLAAAGCGGGGGGGGGGTAASTTPSSSGGSQQSSTTNSTAPSISASPAAQASVGAPYVVTPTAQDPNGDSLAFTIENRPAWAEFSTVTGELRGTPTASHAGTYADIRISVSDGTTTVALPAFSVTVAAAAAAPTNGRGATLSWELPTETSTGAPLGTLAGFRIHYGTRSNVLSETIEVSNPGVLTYVVDTLPAGTYYFAVRAVTTTGEQSSLSNVITKVIS